MVYVKDLPVLEASLESITSILRKVSNDDKMLVVGTFGNEGSGQRTAGIQEGREVKDFWEVTATDCAVDTEQNSFVQDRIGRKTKVLTDGNKQQYHVQIKPMTVQIRAAFHSQSQLRVVQMMNKWLYWQDKLSLVITSKLGTYRIRIDPDDSTPFPSKNLDSSENAKLSIGFVMRTFAGIVKTGFIIDKIDFGVLLVTDDEKVLDEERTVIELKRSEDNT